MKTDQYAIGSDRWPGLSKLIEEAGEFLQVAGKIIGLGSHGGEKGGKDVHWDGSNLRERVEDEIADLLAAAAFFGDVNALDSEKIQKRIEAKYDVFVKWHERQQAQEEANLGRG